jgi:hypothetical protein
MKTSKKLEDDIKTKIEDNLKNKKIKGHLKINGRRPKKMEVDLPKKMEDDPKNKWKTTLFLFKCNFNQQHSTANLTSAKTKNILAQLKKININWL